VVRNMVHNVDRVPNIGYKDAIQKNPGIFLLTKEGVAKEEL